MCYRFYGDHCESELPPTNALTEDPKFAEKSPGNDGVNQEVTSSVSRSISFFLTV